MTDDELQMLEIELDTQIESIKVSRSQGCLKIAPKHICQAVIVCESSSWSTCLAVYQISVCTFYIYRSKGKRANPILFDELVRQGYFVTDSF